MMENLTLCKYYLTQGYWFVPPGYFSIIAALGFVVGFVVGFTVAWFRIRRDMK